MYYHVSSSTIRVILFAALLQSFSCAPVARYKVGHYMQGFLEALKDQPGQRKNGYNYILMQRYVQQRNIEVQDVSFMGLPAKEYWARASAVYYLRARVWSQGGKAGSQCTPEGQRCSLDLLCVGPEGKLQCHRPVEAFGRCDSAYERCEEGLICWYGKCRKEGKLGDKCHPQGKSYYYPKCSEGLFCHPSAYRCARLRQENEYCSNYYGCAPDLECDRGRCRSKIGRGLGRSCGDSYGECKRGLMCVFDYYNYPRYKVRTCAVPRERPRTCDKEECPDGYECKSGVCWRLLKKYSNCYGGTYAVCKPGLKCQLRSSWGRRSSILCL